MKTPIITLLTAALMLGQSSLAAANNAIGYPGEPEKKTTTENTAKPDSAANALISQVRFDYEILPDSNKIRVYLRGQFDPYTSVSITNNRGTEYCFSFVKSGESVVEFSLSDIKPGACFLVLSGNDEIRMKRLKM